MAPITPEMRRLVSRQRLGFMATVCADGSPNLSPKGLTFVLDDSRIVIGNVRSPRTVDNLRARPVAEVNVVDPISRKGFRFKGSCVVHESGADFERLLEFPHDKGAQSDIQSVIVMDVARAAPLVSPVYDSGASEATVRARWRAHYDAIEP